METLVESVRRSEDWRTPAVELRMLGPLAVRRRGAPQALPGSRKVRALLAYLALTPRPVARSQLCELLWDVPNDPRGELRWCLSKIRGLVDEPDRRRVDAEADAVRLDLAGCFVDAVEIARACEKGVGTLPLERLQELAALFAGEFLQGLAIERSPAFDTWLAAQRRRFRGWHAALLERLVADTSGSEAIGYLERWLELAPLDQRVHALLLDALARQGRIREGEEHLAAAVRLFAAEGLDGTPVREAWQSAKARASGPRVQAAAPAATGEMASEREGVGTAASRRASLAVMPFADRSAAPDERGGVADALAHDVITRLAKLRSLFVIAQGTVFALQKRGTGPEEAGRVLKVDYVVGGSVRRQGRRLTVTVELTEVRTARVVWAEVYDRIADDVFLVLGELGDRIVASIGGEIEAIERNRAVLRPPSSLDAWEAHHRGLWHAYRFTESDNERARHFFATAVRLDPTFARAHAGLSFAHFQNAFQGWGRREAEIDRAFEAAGQSLMADDRDPAAHWAMGRALWLRGRHAQAVAELEQAIELSPNFALGHYTLAFVLAQAGDASAAVASSDRSRELSPCDPLLACMLGVRAMALLRLGRFEEAADCGLKAAARPNAHAHVLAIAASSLALAGRLGEARGCLAAIRKTLPRYGLRDFLAAMQLAPEGEERFREAAGRIGMA